MKRLVVLAISTAICASASAQPNSLPREDVVPQLDRVRFGSPFMTPNNCKALEDMSDRQIQAALAKCGKISGLHAEKLQYRMFLYLGTTEPERALPFAQKWLEIYPKLAPDDQRFLADQALSIGKELHADAHVESTEQGRSYKYADSSVSYHSEFGREMIFEIAAAVTRGTWVPSEFAKKRLAEIVQDETFDKGLQSEVQRALQMPTPKSALLAESLVKNLDDKIRNFPIRKLRGEIFLDRSKSNVNVQANPKLPIVPQLANEDIRPILKALTKVYPTLSNTEKHMLAGCTLCSTAKLLVTPLRADAATLLWEVYKSIKPTWLDYGAVADALLCNSASFVFLKDYPSAEKIMLKALAIEDFISPYNYGSVFDRMTVGDFYKQQGNPGAAKEQYLIAQELNDRFLTLANVLGVDNTSTMDTKQRIRQRLNEL